MTAHPVRTVVSQKPFSGPLFRTPASVPSGVQNRVAVSTKTGPTPQWKSQLEKTLFTQGGGQLKKAEIEKVGTLDWKVGNVDVKVDSVIVKLEHVKGYRSSFRAIVDSSNGKILQTWDQPVLDNFSSKNSATVKLDPRYHND
ncbi:MAG: hypothetical protein ACJ76H_06985 [Bacteriovoracaceae bacterium]